MPDVWLTNVCSKTTRNPSVVQLFKRTGTFCRRRIKLIPAVFGFAIVGIVLAGCASHGGKTEVKDLTKYKSICFTQPAPFDQVYMQPVATVFTKYGFNIAPTKFEPDTLICIMGTKENDYFDMSFVITLWSGKKKLLNVEARDEHYADRASTREANDRLVRDALDKLDEAMAKGTKHEDAGDKK
jgi:hypothetical protein